MRFAVIAVMAAACSSSMGEIATKPDEGSAGSGSGAPVLVIDKKVEAKPITPVAPGQRLPDLATPLAYDLRLDVDPDRDVFSGTVEIRIQLPRATDHVWLHADKLVLGAMTWKTESKTGALKDLAIDNDDDMRALSFGAPLEGMVTLAIEYTGKVITDEPEGLFRQKSGGKWYLYAQSESVFARRITPSFDEPRWKPSWKVTLVVPDKLVALGNGAVVKETVAANKKTVELAEIPSMPSYLLSIVVGPYQIVPVGSVGRAKVPARVVVPAGFANSVGVVPLKLPAVVDALEAYLDRPLPLAKLDLVAVPEFFGAMENTGLITFESSLLIGDPKRKPMLVRRFVRFAAHELAHQWFGNQVTQAWWDDLWLAEGFSTWLGDRTADQLGAYADPAMRRQLARLNALEADDEATPRPLRRPIDSEGVEERFDAIAYEKGGALLDMMEEFVGNDAFRDAIRAYVAKHDGGSVTSKDFVNALAVIPGEAYAAMTTYLDIGGAPVVTLEVHCSGKPAIEVRAAAGTVPVCVRFPEGRQCVAASATKGTIFPTSCPAWVIGNAGGEGYYRIANPSAATKAPMTPSEKLAYADDLGAGLLRGDVPLATGLAEISRLAKTKDPINVLGATTIAQAIRPVVLDAERAAWTAWLKPRFGAWNKLNNATDLQDMIALRVWQLLPPANSGKVFLDKTVARAKAAPEAKRVEILRALGGIAPELAPQVVDLAFGTVFKPEQVLPAIAFLLKRPTAREHVWRALVDRLPKLVASVELKQLHDLVAAAGSLCTAEARAEVVAGFTDKVPATQLAKPLASIDRCIARRTKLGDLKSALAKSP